MIRDIYIQSKGKQTKYKGMCSYKQELSNFLSEVFERDFGHILISVDNANILLENAASILDENIADWDILAIKQLDIMAKQMKSDLNKFVSHSIKKGKYA